MRGWTISAKSHCAVSHMHNNCCSPQSLNKYCQCKLTAGTGNTAEYLNNNEKLIQQQLCDEAVSVSVQQLT